MLGLGITNLDIFYYNKKTPSPPFNTKNYTWRRCPYERPK